MIPEQKNAAAFLLHRACLLGLPWHWRPPCAARPRSWAHQHWWGIFRPSSFILALHCLAAGRTSKARTRSLTTHGRLNDLLLQDLCAQRLPLLRPTPSNSLSCSSLDLGQSSATPPLRRHLLQLARGHMCLEAGKCGSVLRVIALKRVHAAYAKSEIFEIANAKSLADHPHKYAVENHTRLPRVLHWSVRSATYVSACSLSKIC
jgi:hypothetical protein